MTKHTSDQIQIDLPADVLVKARGRARSLGISLSAYIKLLVYKDLRAQKPDPWREPVPAEVAERWSRELAEFEEEEKTNPRPGAKTGAELIKLLDEEAAALPDDEGN